MSEEDERESQMASNPLPMQSPPMVGTVDPVRTAAVVATFQTASMPPPPAKHDEDEGSSETKNYVVCTEKDVLMGRGKRISEWPGNQKFRAIVAKFRPVYLSSLRSAKIQVAQQVIAEVHEEGGRFLRELDPGNTGVVAWSKWLPVDMDRCIEKTCQALREKEKSQKRKTLPSSEPVFATCNAKKLKSHDSDDELFQRLLAFRERHGHTAVPPGWPKDRDLADWATVQRRLFRDLKEGAVVELHKPTYTKRRADFPDDLGVFAEEEKREELILETNETLPGATISEQQQLLVDKLREIGFCADYEQWHWEHCFKLFVEGDSVMKRVWLRQQRRDYREGALREDRRVRLQDAGVNWLIPIEVEALEVTL